MAEDFTSDPCIVQGGYVFTLLVSLFVSRITQKLLNRLSQNSVQRLHIGNRRTSLIFVVIWITLR